MHFPVAGYRDATDLPLLNAARCARWSRRSNRGFSGWFPAARRRVPSRSSDGTDVRRPSPRGSCRADPSVDRLVRVGRLIGSAIAMVIVCAGAYWLVRTPPPPTEASLPWPPRPRRAPSTRRPPIASAAAGRVAAGGHDDARSRWSTWPARWCRPVSTGRRRRTRRRGDHARRRTDARCRLERGESRRPVVDGSRIYVPRVGESIPPEVAPTGIGPAARIERGRLERDRGRRSSTSTSPRRRTRRTPRRRPGHGGGDRHRARTQRSVRRRRRPRPGARHRAGEARRPARPGDDVSADVCRSGRSTVRTAIRRRPSPPPPAPRNNRPRCRRTARRTAASSRPTSPSGCGWPDATPSTPTSTHITTDPTMASGYSDRVAERCADHQEPGRGEHAGDQTDGAAPGPCRTAAATRRRSRRRSPGRSARRTARACGCGCGTSADLR